MDFILHNQTYLEALIIIYAEMLVGKIPSKDMVDQAKRYGRLAKVPEKELNALEIVGYDNATIH